MTPDSSCESGDRPPYPPTLGEALDEIASRLEAKSAEAEEDIGSAPTNLQARKIAGVADGLDAAAQIVREYDGDSDA